MSKHRSRSDLIDALTGLTGSNRRRLIAIAGPPASGKSHLADWLAAELRSAGRAVTVIPMDGFHLDNRILKRCNLVARKGAPETFDAAGFINLVQRARRGGGVVYPVFDRERDIAIAGAAQLDSHCEIVLFEGNYLLFDQDPWRELSALWDLSVWLDTPETLTRERCIQRWLEHDHSREQAIARAQGNDVKNARLINTTRLPADITLNDGAW